jgi:HicA toxin of bacterial toxin-antitoxin,
MSQRDKLLAKILIGDSDGNIPFAPLCQLLESLGFELRIRGSHHIVTKEGIPDILNLQPQDGKVKKYQVRQVRVVIIQHHLGE